MVQRIAGEHHVGRRIRPRREHVGQIAANQFDPPRPDCHVVARPLDRRLGQVDAEVVLDVRIAKSMRRQPRIARTEIDNPTAAAQTRPPIRRAPHQLRMLHVIMPHHGIVHRPLLEDFLHKWLHRGRSWSIQQFVTWWLDRLG